MNIRLRARPSTLAALMTVALAVANCGESESPMAPTGTSAVSAVAFNTSTVSVGTSVLGTVSLTGAALAGGASIVLSSSDVAVATVPTPVMIAAGASTAAFTITTMLAGSTTITAAMDGTSVSSMLTVTVEPVLSAVSLSAPTVVGGNALVGTVTLSGFASSGGVLVALSAAGPVTVPGTVLVPGGLLSASFEVATRAVGSSIDATVSGTYGGVSKSASLSVTAAAVTAAIARFGISGTIVTDTCQLLSDGNHLECTFNGSASTAPGTIVEWEWSYSVATTVVRTTSGPVLTMPEATCALLPAPPLPAGTASFPFTVRLTIRDSLGNISPEAVYTGARVLPQGACGF
jgi:hypothetical protein